MSVYTREVEERQPETVEQCVGDQRMVCRFRAGKYRWTWHDEKGRLLLDGPEDFNKWKAHRMFLDAIRDQAVSGRGFSED